MTLCVTGFETVCFAGWLLVLVVAGVCFTDVVFGADTAGERCTDVAFCAEEAGDFTVCDGVVDLYDGVCLVAVCFTGWLLVFVTAGACFTDVVLGEDA